VFTPTASNALNSEPKSVIAQAAQAATPSPAIMMATTADTSVNKLVQAWELLMAANDAALNSKIEEFGAFNASDLEELEAADLEEIALLLKKVQRKQFCRLVGLPV
jgi:hypothetical protein